MSVQVVPRTPAIGLQMPGCGRAGAQASGGSGTHLRKRTVERPMKVAGPTSTAQ